jgi:hypothetical protein
VDEVFHFGSAGGFSPFHDVVEFFHGVFEGTADGGVFGVWFGGYGFDVGIAERDVVVVEV